MLEWLGMVNFLCVKIERARSWHIDTVKAFIAEKDERVNKSSFLLIEHNVA